ncbi:hypothetical protein BBH88_18485 (plasmid) [Planococcus antarcticus DSM 14505]|uniref:Uncharacterized protein n=1 Tax=Planococcus antarcticus DSM 14505 TaxID=1185653 RepID=A0ABM6FQM4_9BACL|nr:hypothetical protein [Planococcus antarcticus]APA28445.1 hypothetical protein BBH88_18485 [Planococcus antarcticus DSM 14505]
MNEKDGTVIIEREVELESRIGKEYFNELVQTLEKLNEVLASPEGEEYKKEIRRSKLECCVDGQNKWLGLQPLLVLHILEPLLGL